MNNNHLCPNCHVSSFTVWQKLSLGPLKKIQCGNCGGFVGVPWAKSLAVLAVGSVTPLLGGLLALMLLPKPAGIIATVMISAPGLVLGGALFLWLYNRFVPLVVKRA